MCVRVGVIVSSHAFALVMEPRDLLLPCGTENQCRWLLQTIFALNNHELHGASQPGNQTRKLKDIAQQVPAASNEQQQCNCFAALNRLAARNKQKACVQAEQVAPRKLVSLSNTTAVASSTTSGSTCSGTDVVQQLYKFMRPWLISDCGCAGRASPSPCSQRERAADREGEKQKRERERERESEKRESG